MFEFCFYSVKLKNFNAHFVNVSVCVCLCTHVDTAHTQTHIRTYIFLLIDLSVYRSVFTHTHTHTHKCKHNHTQQEPHSLPQPPYPEPPPEPVHSDPADRQQSGGDLSLFFCGQSERRAGWRHASLKLSCECDFMGGGEGGWGRGRP